MRLVSLMIVFAGLAFGVGARAAEPAPTKPAATPAPQPAKQAADEKKEDATAAEPAAKIDDAKTAAEKAAAKPADAKASPQRFIPSEQVRADFDVSFPIDI